jgi:hypothetical protein
MGSSDPKTYKLPQDMTTETLDTPDLQAFQSFDPRVNNVRPILAKRFNQERSDTADNYGAYTGIPEVARQRMQEQAMGNIGVDQSTADAGNVNVGNATRLDQMETLAGLTRKTRSSGYTSSLGAPGQSAAATGIGAAASIGATIIAV